MEEYNLTHREKRVILDEVKGLKVILKYYSDMNILNESWYNSEYLESNIQTFLRATLGLYDHQLGIMKISKRDLKFRILTCWDVEEKHTGIFY